MAIQNKKKRQGWKHVGPKTFVGPLIISEIVEAKEKPARLIISLSAKTGIAVRRNRLRRTIRAFFEKRRLEKTIWIRFHRDFKIPPKILSKDFHTHLQKFLNKNSKKKIEGLDN